MQKDIAMKRLYLLILIYIGLSLSGCATNNKSITPNNPNTLAKKDPISVTFYTHGQKPTDKYTIIGKGTISKFNVGGIKRQTATLHDAMRNLAASMGGDAIINIEHDDKSITATVIAYQKMPMNNTEASA